jgi:hypothetical protein
MPAHRRPRLSRLVAALLAAVVALPALPGMALGWANNGDGYGTHDWFIGLALEVLDGRADGWFDADAAFRASDDPDIDRTLGAPGDHVYRETGVRGGAVQNASQHYSAALADYRAGADARTRGDETAARSSFTAASREIGLLSHFYADILQPYHSAYAGLNKSRQHAAYEDLVAPLTRTPGAMPAWHSSSRSVRTIANIRGVVAAAAAYSRGKFPALHAEMKASPSRLTPRARDITGSLARRGAQDLANIIWSISRGAGESPDVARLSARIKWVGVAANEDAQAVFVTARDAQGRGIEGLELDISWPLADGSVATVRRWTDPTGYAKYTAPVGGGPLMVRRLATVRATATTPDRTVTTTGWFMATRRLADGRAGFRTVVGDATVAAGETAVVTSVARDRLGRAMPGLLVTWTWKVGTRTFRTRGLTGPDGRATTTYAVTTSTPHSLITVSAHVQAASVNRYSSTSLRRP